MLRRMDEKTLFEALISYFCLIPAIACHEFAHAWMADKCGDDTPRMQGRVTLNPIAHMELLGTVILPLLCFSFSRGSGFMFGWGRPVQVNPSNFRNRRRDDTLVSAAGPAMNLILAMVAMIVAKVAAMLGLNQVHAAGVHLAEMSTLLGVFNLLPIPPLDGSHVVKNLILMREETYLNLCQYGFLFVFIAIQVPALMGFVYKVSWLTMSAMATVVRLPL